MDSVLEFENWNNVRGGEDRENTALEASKKDVHFIHVDASISEEGFMTMRCIIKDQHHIISIVVYKREDVSVEVAVGEAMAICWGLYLDKELQL